MEGCSNGARSADPSAFYYTWRDDSGAAEVVYAVTTPDDVKAVHEWTITHAVELKRVEALGPGSWMPLDFLFEVYPNGSRREHALMRAIPAPGWEEKPKGTAEWVPNLSEGAIEELRRIFRERGERVDQLPEGWW
jgi:hypothetical protein